MNRHKNMRRAMTLFVFQIQAASLILAFLFLFFLSKLFPDTYTHWMVRPLLLIGILLAACSVVGTVISFFLTKHFLKPMSELMDATKAVAAGDYSVRVVTEKMALDIKDYHSPVNEFEDFVESFNKMAEALGSVEMLRSDFVNTISHEFKTPVVSIRGYAKLLQDPNLTDEQRREYTDTILQESQRLSSMSSNILLLSRYEHTEVLTGKTVFSLDEQLRDCIRLQSRAWLDKDIILSGELESVMFYGNPDIMNHLWSNLLSNAIKFTPAGGAVSVSLTQREGAVVVRFSDSGIGMDEETLSHIYEKFYQADSSRQSAGNGLGLSIVKRIVTICGGDVAVESEPGLGTTFTVTIPAEPLPPAEGV